jgi:uncharacterized cupin superfamily protein
MAKVILMIDPATVELEPSPIRKEWILDGAPTARSTKLVSSDDRVSAVLVWDCSPGSFHWHYDKEETIFVLSGEAFMTNDQGEVRRIAAGDVGFFPAGYSCDWRVTQHFRKVAVLRESMWLPLGLGLKAWNKFLSSTGLSGKSSL